MKYLVTGAAGFIGMHTCLKLMEKNHKVIALDNLNSYYDIKLKKARLNILKKNKKFKFYKIDITNKNKIKKIFKKFAPSHVIHLAAQPGVRYSIKNPDVYTKSNLLGFSNILECCRNNRIKHLIFASSSSVYGGNLKFPFSEKDNVDHPISYYAATKKSNELMAHSYSCLFKIPITGLRFFTVYGPWGRPDMSLFLFTKAIKNNLPIKVFNKGNMYRDFTYIDDIVEAVYKISKKIPKLKRKFKSKKMSLNNSFAPYKVFNIGGNKPLNLKSYISILEKILKKKAKKIFFHIQAGDIKYTHASLIELKKWINFKPKTNLKHGIKLFVDWYNDFYK